MVLAGGGVRGGHVLGVSDLTAAHPMTPPISPDDQAMTIYHALGIDSRSEVRDALGRPLPLAEGRLQHALFSTVGERPSASSTDAARCLRGGENAGRDAVVIAHAWMEKEGWKRDR